MNIADYEQEILLTLLDGNAWSADVSGIPFCRINVHVSPSQIFSVSCFGRPSGHGHWLAEVANREKSGLACTCSFSEEWNTFGLEFALLKEESKQRPAGQTSADHSI